MTDQEPIADKRRRSRIASTYQPDPGLEALRQRLDRDPDLTISPQLRIQLGLYESSKSAAAEQRIKDRS